MLLMHMLCSELTVGFCFCDTRPLTGLSRSFGASRASPYLFLYFLRFTENREIDIAKTTYYVAPLCFPLRKFLARIHYKRLIQLMYCSNGSRQPYVEALSLELLIPARQRAFHKVCNSSCLVVSLAGVTKLYQVKSQHLPSTFP